MEPGLMATALASIVNAVKIVLVERATGRRDGAWQERL
jgi:threonine dehydrogenase-like Zn-dependent dehydrogenase